MKKDKAVFVILLILIASSFGNVPLVQVKAQITMHSSSSEFSKPPAMAWSRVYGTGNCDLAPSVVQTSDGGYALVGDVTSDTHRKNALFIKTDALGDVIWSRVYSSPETFREVLQTPDEGYVLIGNTNGAGFTLMKTTSTGDAEWNQTYIGTIIASNAIGGIEATSIVHTSDGGYAIAGNVGVQLSTSSGSTYGFLIKTDALGNLQWSRLYLQSGVNDFWSLVQTSGQGYAMAGSANHFDSIGTNFWLVKTDAKGNALWNKTYEMENGSSEIFSIVETVDGGYALAGNFHSWAIGSSIVLLVKTDSFGNMIWNQTYDRYYLKSLIQTSDSGLAFAGTATVQVRNGPDLGSLGAACLVKLSPTGRIEWDETFCNPVANFDVFSPIQDNYMATCVIETSEGGIVLAGSWYKNSFSEYYFLVKTEPSLHPPSPSIMARQTSQPAQASSPTPSLLPSTLPTSSPSASEPPTKTPSLEAPMPDQAIIASLGTATILAAAGTAFMLKKKKRTNADSPRKHLPSDTLSLPESER